MKIDDWFKFIALILAVVFLFIFYRYSDNGRYIYHKEIGGVIDNKYIIDTRSGIIYGETASSLGRSNFYEINLITGEVILKPHKIIDNMSTASPEGKNK